jgi:hypothetical protein
MFSPVVLLVEIKLGQLVPSFWWKSLQPNRITDIRKDGSHSLGEED